MPLLSKDGISLHLHSWRAEPQVATVALVHGYGEHAGRYAHVAEAFGRLGISVHAVDLRGHGRSAGRRSHVDRFEEYHWDAQALLEHARQSAQGAPVFLFGHSMGALIVMDWLLSGAAQDVAGVVLSSPYLGVALEVPAVKVAAGKIMSRLLPTLALPTGIRGEHVTRDPEQARLYETDPLMGQKATARWFTESNAAIARSMEQAARLERPLLLLYGGADRLASAGATDRLAQQLTAKDRTVERLEGFAHELVNEPPADRAVVIERMGRWILERAQRR